MRKWLYIWLLLGIISIPEAVDAKTAPLQIYFDFYGYNVGIETDSSIIVPYSEIPTTETIQAFYSKMDKGNYLPVITALLKVKEEHKLNDWFFYQLIRRTAQEIAPKVENYPRYTLYKWFFLGKSGYDARLSLSNERLIFFVRSDENVYDIPYYTEDGKQYVCLNIHDYLNPDFQNHKVFPSNVSIPEGQRPFSYKVTQVPDFRPAAYAEKNLAFSYNNETYHFKVKVNPQLQKIFGNYPVVDYESYFNIPLSAATYNSLVPVLKNNIKDMGQKSGVDYLMRFTRNAFLYEDDRKSFGKEKRMSPEQTLLTDYSDCDDRAALFFYLVKEIYDLPMIVLLYPTHVTIAVKFDKPVGKSIVYKGEKYSICEPTPQEVDLDIGQISPQFRNMPYEIAYEYHPAGH